MEAITKRTEARISCAPYACQGKCGERIHNKSGIMTIRLIVIEFGKFTLSPVESTDAFLRPVLGSRSVESQLKSFNPGHAENLGHYDNYKRVDWRLARVQAT
jgi:hypothetical protein